MNLKKNHYSRRALALLLTLVMCVGMIPTAFAAQQNSYHDPAEHWMQASGRTNELDANSVVTRETFKCVSAAKPHLLRCSAFPNIPAMASLHSAAM